MISRSTHTHARTHACIVCMWMCHRIGWSTRTNTKTTHQRTGAKRSTRRHARLVRRPVEEQLRSDPPPRNHDFVACGLHGVQHRMVGGAGVDEPPGVARRRRACLARWCEGSKPMVQRPAVQQQPQPQSPSQRPPPPQCVSFNAALTTTTTLTTTTSSGRTRGNTHLSADAAFFKAARQSPTLTFGATFNSQIQLLPATTREFGSPLTAEPSST